ncbi:recombinase family protein [Bacillus pumilus]|uniref:recombinase family protein n=1 Tax=Bacillus TaxID=1386 RepID=UPI001CFB45F6|nr:MULTISPECIES: recombinase family protein [Bacillus]MED4810923.1 recombinase family protein [Bacillus atrophaeus]MED4858782.1 recombinase family protein [Bacillus atrophaeus]UCZ70922.1 recombinase family protein [Bacillus pumilus]
MISRDETAQQNQDKIVIYTRNTSWTQPEGYRIHRDVQVLKEKCERAGYRVSRVYWEPSSESQGKRRKVLKQMLEDAAEGLFGAVVVWDVFTLTPDGKELQQIERELARYGVEIFSVMEPFDTSTGEGLRVFEYMCKLLNTRHLRLAAMQGIPLSQVARWGIEDEKKKGGEDGDELCETA